MSEAVLAIATSAKPPTLWVWSAAIQDYAPVSESMVKISSDQEQLSVQLIRVPKLIAVVQSHISEGARQIGFKLTAGSSVKQMLTAADSLRQSYQLSAVVANRVEDLKNGVRAHWVDASGSEAIPNSQNLTERISLFIEEA